jgi:hypothetical protein
MALSYNTVSNRIPELSFVAPQNFYAVAENLPGVVFNLQAVIIPNVTGGEVPLPNRLNSSRAFIPGNGLDYSSLDFTFLIDKDFNNYRSVLEWIKSINHPEDHNQYDKYTTSANQVNQEGFSRTTSNLTVFGCDDGNKPLVHWNFVNSFPISLDGPQYDAASANIDYITSVASFRYLYFEHQTYTNGKLNNDKL